MIIIFHLFYPYIFLLSRQNLKQKTHTEPKTETLQLTFYYIDLKVYRSRNKPSSGGTTYLPYQFALFRLFKQASFTLQAKRYVILWLIKPLWSRVTRLFVQATHSLSISFHRSFHTIAWIRFPNQWWWYWWWWWWWRC